MRTNLTALAGLVVATTLVGGCSANSTSPTAISRSAIPVATSSSSSPNPAPARLTDYTRLLIQASDIDGPEAFTADPPRLGGNPPVTVLGVFRNADGTHVISDGIDVEPDPAAATRKLEGRKIVAQAGTVHGWPEPIDIGTGGATLTGPSPDGSNSVTALMFTEGKAFVEIDFDGPPKTPVPPDVVTDVGRKQDAAIKSGLAG